MRGLDAGDDRGDLFIRLVDILFDFVLDICGVALVGKSIVILRVSSSKYTSATAMSKEK